MSPRNISAISVLALVGGAPVRIAAAFTVTQPWGLGPANSHDCRRGRSDEHVVVARPPSSSYSATSSERFMTIVSPFDNSGGDEASGGDAPVATYTPTEAVEGDGEYLELTWENVEMVLDDMRPYLMQDGGNVAIQEIDGPVVRLELQGACGTCPSSTQTMKMGLERGLREKIPEIQEVVQAMPEGPPLTEEQVDVVLDGVRPFLQVAGGTIDCEEIRDDSVQPSILLKMGGASATLNSVKLEIAQRLQRHFMIAGLRVDWA